MKNEWTYPVYKHTTWTQGRGVKIGLTSRSRKSEKNEKGLQNQQEE